MRVDRLPSAEGCGDDAVRLRYDDVGRFRVVDGREVVVDPADGASPVLVARVLLGRAAGYLVHQRGRLVLHASAARVGGRTVLFAGDRGAGKSTTAAACLARGHDVLACDLVAFEASPRRVRSGFPLLKLSEASAAAVEADLEPAFPPVDAVEKRYYDVADHFVEDAATVDRVYVLGERDGAPRVESLDGVAATMALVDHSYAKPILEATGTVERNFRQCASVAETVPVKRLHRPDALQRLPELVETVEDDLGV